MTDIITPEEVERLANEHNSAALSLDSGDHTVVERLFRAGEMLRYRAIPMAALIATQAAEIERLREAIRGLFEHSCIAEAHPEDKTADDWAAEAVARAALEQEGGL